MEEFSLEKHLYNDTVLGSPKNKDLVHNPEPIIIIFDFDDLHSLEDRIYFGPSIYIRFYKLYDKSPTDLSWTDEKVKSDGDVGISDSKVSPFCPASQGSQN